MIQNICYRHHHRRVGPLLIFIFLLQRFLKAKTRVMKTGHCYTLQHGASFTLYAMFLCNCHLLSNAACNCPPVILLLVLVPHFSPVSHDKSHQLLVQLQRVQLGVKDGGVGLHERQDDGAVLQVDVCQVLLHSFWDACALQEPCSLFFRPVARKPAALPPSAPGEGSINSFLLQNLSFLVLCRFLFSGRACS